MRDVLVSWGYSTIDENGGPSVAKELHKVVVSMSAGGSFAWLGDKFPPSNMFPMEAVDIGLYVLRLEAFDVDGVSVNQVDTPFEVPALPDGTLPANIINVSVDLA